MAGLDGATLLWAFFGLVVVPIVIWISPNRPLFGWQLPIITLAICSVVTHPEYPGQPFDLGSDLGMALLIWVALLLFSSPWGLFFMRRAQRAQSTGASGVGEVKGYSLALFLVVICGLLLLGGWVMILAPNSSVWAPPGGVLVGTIGIMTWIACERISSGLGRMRELVRSFMVVEMLLTPLMALGGGHHGSQLNSGWSAVISGSILGIEAVSVLSWLWIWRKQSDQSRSA